MIFDGFNTSNEVGRTEAVSTSRAYYTQAVAQDVALRAVEVYLEVLKRRELVTLARTTCKLTCASTIRLACATSAASAAPPTSTSPAPVAPWRKTTWTPPKSTWPMPRPTSSV